MSRDGGSIPPASSTQVVVQKEVSEPSNNSLSPGLAFLVQNDARFRRIAEAWTRLSDEQQARIIAIVKGEEASH